MYLRCYPKDDISYIRTKYAIMYVHVLTKDLCYKICMHTYSVYACTYMHTHSSICIATLSSNLRLYVFVFCICTYIYACTSMHTYIIFVFTTILHL